MDGQGEVSLVDSQCALIMCYVYFTYFLFYYVHLVYGAITQKLSPGNCMCLQYVSAMMLQLARYCSASKIFVQMRILTNQAIVRKLSYTIIRRQCRSRFLVVRYALQYYNTVLL